MDIRNLLFLQSSFTFATANKLNLILLALLLIQLTISSSHAAINLSENQYRTWSGSETWLNLLHFRAKVFTSARESQADDDDFFFSSTGKQDANAELRAFISAINNFESGINTLKPTDNDKHPACRFPARYQWLSQQLLLPTLPEQISCPELENWLTELNAERITLVYAASYLNSPSSMFGHTFLRIDPPAMSTDKLLVTNTISYSADAAEHDTELMFAYRGIFGGYPGITIVEPYYQKLKLYNDIENRDLWEYELNLNPAEVRTLLLHTWETKDIQFDYFFFDENCAYRLFTLIDVARPSIKLTEAIPTLRAIPADTVRIVVDKNIVANITYRPSNASVIEHQLKQLSDSQKNAVEDFLHNDFGAIDNELTPAEAAKALETAYELQQYRAIDKDLPREISAPVAFALLKQRGELDIQTKPRLPPAPSIRDDEGHDTLRFGIFGGRVDDANYLAFEWRPAYHDLDDPLPGYRKGAHLQFFNTELRWYTDNNELQLEKFKFVEIISLTPKSRFFKPWSWQAGFGARRSWIKTEQRPFTPYVDGLIGSTLVAGPALLTAALTANAEPSANLPSGGMLEAGLGLFLNYQSKQIRLSVNAEQRADVLGTNEARKFFEAKFSYSVFQNHAIHVRAKVFHSTYESTEDIGLGWYSYF